MTELLETLRALLGPAHVLTGDDAAGYTRDWTGKYAWTPLAVLRPADTGEVAGVMRAADAAGVAVVPVSGNTGLAGGTHAEGQLMLSLERLNRIREIRAGARVCIAEAGVVLAQVHAAVAAHGLSFPLSFGAQGSARVGGFVSTNAGGSNVVRYGNTRALVLGVEVVLADGRVLDLMGALHKDNTGYDLKDLIVGAEGTLGIVTAAVLKLVPAPVAHATAMVALPDLTTALGLLNRLQGESGGLVEAFEFMPDRYWRRMARFRPDIACPFAEVPPVTVLVELGSAAPAAGVPGPDGSLPLTADLEAALAAAMERGEVLDAVIAQSGQQRRQMWVTRESAAEITLNVVPIVDCDVALPLDRMQAYLDAMAPRLAAIDPGADLLYIAHLGDGNYHYTVYPTTGDPAVIEAIRLAIGEEAVRLGGSFSAEHGIGLSKQAEMRALKSPVARDVMRAIKAALDPKGLLNPGKTIG
ncbi:FAD-binding oxidoreductase [Frigidibacter sp. MR17.24]|uniref:FAD-binding oxidoreductase n=1 Tax=Frigidibacter sp. MR17.24 TaxID=3127345 RepID=UPI0030131D92